MAVLVRVSEGVVDRVVERIGVIVLVSDGERVMVRVAVCDRDAGAVADFVVAGVRVEEEEREVVRDFVGCCDGVCVAVVLCDGERVGVAVAVGGRNGEAAREIDDVPEAAPVAERECVGLPDGTAEDDDVAVEAADEVAVACAVLDPVELPDGTAEDDDVAVEAADEVADGEMEPLEEVVGCGVSDGERDLVAAAVRLNDGDAEPVDVTDGTADWLAVEVDAAVLLEEAVRELDDVDDGVPLGLPEGVAVVEDDGVTL